MNSMKRQKDKTLKDELPRSVGALYAAREERRTNSRKNEEKEPKQKNKQKIVQTRLKEKSVLIRKTSQD